MKKIFTLSIILLSVLYSSAYPFQSMLTISSNTKYPIQVVIDNRTNYDGNSQGNDFAFRNIRSGYHLVKIYREKKNFYGNRNDKNGRLQLIYNENIYIKPGYHVDISFNRFGKVLVDEQQFNGEEDDDTDNHPGHHWNNQTPGPQAISISEFNQFKQSISNGNFESTKLALAKQGISQNYFQAFQIKQLLEVFNFDNSKLELAKYAYNYTLDKNKYYLVSDAFSFSSSKESLAKFLATQQ